MPSARLFAGFGMIWRREINNSCKVAVLGLIFIVVAVVTFVVVVVVVVIAIVVAVAIF